MSRPILLDYITSRTGEGEKLFVYDYAKDMNVLKSNQDMDFIEYGKVECVTQAETRVAREADDKEYGLCELELGYVRALSNALFYERNRASFNIS